MPASSIIPIIPIQDTRSVSRPRASGAWGLNALPPLSLYVHIPWCVRKCPYCDFNSHEHADGFAALPEMEYVAALRADLESALPLFWGRRVHSVFIGGGTPSLFSAVAIDTLLADIRARVLLDADAEITMEANPGTFEATKFAEFARSGVNRLSIGIQSFDDRALHALGRIHSGSDARRAIDIALAHFENFNLDLMYALPGQSMEDSRRDVELALLSGAPHLSMYHLTLEPNTLFARHPPVLPEDDEAAEMQDEIDERLRAAGYENYEVSAYARSQRTSRHNLNYWNFGDYLGIGAGAHSKLSFPDRIVRQVRTRQPKSYLEGALAGVFLQEDRTVPVADLPFEFMLNALRLNSGFTMTRFSERTGLSAESIRGPLELARARGLLEVDGVVVCPTLMGRRFLNDLQELFLPDASGDAPK